MISKSIKFLFVACGLCAFGTHVQVKAATLVKQVENINRRRSLVRIRSLSPQAAGNYIWVSINSPKDPEMRLPNWQLFSGMPLPEHPATHFRLTLFKQRAAGAIKLAISAPHADSGKLLDYNQPDDPLKVKPIIPTPNVFLNAYNPNKVSNWEIEPESRAQQDLSRCKIKNIHHGGYLTIKSQIGTVSLEKQTPQNEKDQLFSIEEIEADPVNCTPALEAIWKDPLQRGEVITKIVVQKSVSRELNPNPILYALTNWNRVFYGKLSRRTRGGEPTDKSQKRANVVTWHLIRQKLGRDRPWASIRDIDSDGAGNLYGIYRTRPKFGNQTKADKKREGDKKGWYRSIVQITKNNNPSEATFPKEYGWQMGESNKLRKYDDKKWPFRMMSLAVSDPSTVFGIYGNDRSPNLGVGQWKYWNRHVKKKFKTRKEKRDGSRDKKAKDHNWNYYWTKWPRATFPKQAYTSRAFNIALGGENLYITDYNCPHGRTDYLGLTGDIWQTSINTQDAAPKRVVLATPGVQFPAQQKKDYATTYVVSDVPEKLIAANGPNFVAISVNKTFLHGVFDQVDEVYNLNSVIYGGIKADAAAITNDGQLWMVHNNNLYLFEDFFGEQSIEEGLKNLTDSAFYLDKTKQNAHKAVEALRKEAHLTEIKSFAKSFDNETLPKQTYKSKYHYKAFMSQLLPHLTKTAGDNKTARGYLAFIITKIKDSLAAHMAEKGKVPLYIKDFYQEMLIELKKLPEPIEPKVPLDVSEKEKTPPEQKIETKPAPVHPSVFIPPYFQRRLVKPPKKPLK